MAFQVTTKQAPPRARTAERAARDAVIAAVSTYATLISEVQWKTGYRCGKGAGWSGAADVERRELELWRAVSQAAKRVNRKLTAYARAIRRTTR